MDSISITFVESEQELILTRGCSTVRVVSDTNKYDQARSTTDYSSGCIINQTDLICNHQEFIACTGSFIIYNLHPNMLDWFYNHKSNH